MYDTLDKLFDKLVCVKGLVVQTQRDLYQNQTMSSPVF